MEERHLKTLSITSAQLSEESQTLLQYTLVQMTLQTTIVPVFRLTWEKYELVTELSSSAKIVLSSIFYVMTRAISM